MNKIHISNAPKIRNLSDIIHAIIMLKAAFFSHKLKLEIKNGALKMLIYISYNSLTFIMLVTTV